MSFISFKYFGFLLLIVLALTIFKNFKNKYLIVLLFNIVSAYLFGIKTLLFVIIVSLYSYLISKLIIKNKKYLALGIIPIVALLVAYKVLVLYESIIVPIGLSFYSLQVIGYLVDLSKDSSIYEDNLLLYATSVSFFPAFSSGPIEKVAKISKQLKDNLGYDSNKASRGIQLIAEGLFKKLVIANRIVEYVDKVYSSPNSYNGLTILIAIIFYSIQIYCDFSAYSDIAIGSANLMGIDLTKNFDSPYFSKSIKEFWRKWHISLSSWLRDYVYIPLGGNKKHKFLNVIITFVVSGLWHGINLTYFIWGLIHGLLNAIPYKKKDSKLHTIVSVLVTFILVSLSWVFFRANNVSDALLIFKGLFTRFSINYNSVSQSVLLFTNDISSIPYSLATFVMILILVIKEWICVYKKDRFKENLYLLIIVICIILFSTNGSGAFIYQGF